MGERPWLRGVAGEWAMTKQTWQGCKVDIEVLGQWDGVCGGVL